MPKTTTNIVYDKYYSVYQENENLKCRNDSMDLHNQYLTSATTLEVKKDIKESKMVTIGRDPLVAKGFVSSLINKKEKIKSLESTHSSKHWHRNTSW